MNFKKFFSEDTVNQEQEKQIVMSSGTLVLENRKILHVLENIELGDIQVKVFVFIQDEINPFLFKQEDSPSNFEPSLIFKGVMLGRIF